MAETAEAAKASRSAATREPSRETAQSVRHKNLNRARPSLSYTHFEFIGKQNTSGVRFRVGSSQERPSKAVTKLVEVASWLRT